MKHPIHPWWLWRKITAALFLTLLILGSFAWFPWFHGSTTGTNLFNLIPFTDPLAALEITLADKTLHWQFLLGAALLTLLAFIMGPIFCGWICPLGFILDLNHTLRNTTLRLLGKNPTHQPVTKGKPHHFLRYFFLGIAIGFSLIAQLPIFQILSPINILARNILFTLSPAIAIIAFIIIIEWWSPRLWCRTLCPLGALYSILGRFGLLRIRINPALAGKTPCAQCTRHCPMGIRVLEDFAAKHRPSVDHPSCTRCGECIDLCPKGVLRLRFRNIQLHDNMNTIPDESTHCKLNEETPIPLTVEHHKPKAKSPWMNKHNHKKTNHQK